MYLPGEAKKKRYVFPLADKEPAVNDEIGMFGHPFGMQLKYTYGVLSKNNPDAKFYEAQIDAFAGNSGSPVFTKYGAVFGILVGGFSMQSTGRFNLKASNPNDAQFVTESDYFGALESNANTVAECICKYTTFVDIVKQRVPNLATPIGAEEFSVGEGLWLICITFGSKHTCNIYNCFCSIQRWILCHSCEHVAQRQGNSRIQKVYWQLLE